MVLHQHCRGLQVGHYKPGNAINLTISGLPRFGGLGFRVDCAGIICKLMALVLEVAQTEMEALY